MDSKRLLWALVLVLQHSLSSGVDLAVYCRRRCLVGRGGILCKCRANHFGRKRSYDPKHNYNIDSPLSQAHHQSQRILLLSKLSEPKAYHMVSSTEREDTSGELNLDEPVLKEDDADSLIRDGAGAGNTFDLKTHKFLKILPMYYSHGSKAALTRPGSLQKSLDEHPGLTGQLAKLIKYTWQQMAPISKTHDGTSPLPTNSGRIFLDKSEKDSGATGRVLDTNIAAFDYTPAKSNVRTSILAMEELVDKLPHIFHDKSAEGDQNNMTPKTDRRSKLNNMMHFKKGAWYRLMKYIAHNLAHTERPSSLQSNRLEENIITESRARPSDRRL